MSIFGVDDSCVELISQITRIFAVSGLDQQTRYLIRVRASTKQGYGPWSDIVTVTTASRPPDPPKLELIEIQKSKIIMKCNFSKLPFHPVQNFEVMWSGAGEALSKCYHEASQETFEVRG